MDYTRVLTQHITYFQIEEFKINTTQAHKYVLMCDSNKT